MSATLRGLGLQRAAATVSLVSFYLIALPFGCAFVWLVNMGVMGMWYSLAIGTGTAVVALTVILCKVDYVQRAKESDQRIQANAIKQARTLNLESNVRA